MGKIPKSFVKYVLKLNYDITGSIDITQCGECGKTRLCQEYEKPDNSLFYLCEQCTWQISPWFYRAFYEG